MKEIITQLLILLKEGKIEEFNDLLIEKFSEFPKEIQLTIVSHILESYLIEETEKYKTLNSILSEYLKEAN